ncbi:hypothetical protein AVEN_191677-1 [Araneus ventricosus]|uniref:Uncharacterized protein n=1 Tax=Araneus ventricosus TaxID=182803 RepID=A0A4Y2UIV4_ARAVE|nr:hypothetical protein AVEN_191677-1 [Araneus ventricosus]
MLKRYVLAHACYSQSGMGCCACVQPVDTPLQASIRNHCRDPPPTPDDLLSSPAEIEAAVKNPKRQKSPRPDGLFGDVVKEAFKSNKTFHKFFLTSASPKGTFRRDGRQQIWSYSTKRIRPTQILSAFRSMCLLDAMGKILDKLITQRIFWLISLFWHISFFFSTRQLRTQHCYFKGELTDQRRGRPSKFDLMSFCRCNATDGTHLIHISSYLNQEGIKFFGPEP